MKSDKTIEKEHDLVVAESLYKVVQALAGLDNEERLRVLKSAKEATNTADSRHQSQIEAMASKVIFEQIDKAVSSQVNDPNSAVSRSLQKNLNVCRKRW
jgi:hypothetical protein